MHTDKIRSLCKKVRECHDIPAERQEAYMLAEEIDTELNDMGSTLRACIKKINEKQQKVLGASKDDPVSQIVQVLDVHLSAFQSADLLPEQRL